MEVRECGALALALALTLADEVMDERALLLLAVLAVFEIFRVASVCCSSDDEHTRRALLLLRDMRSAAAPGDAGTHWHCTADAGGTASDSLGAFLRRPPESSERA